MYNSNSTNTSNSSNTTKSVNTTNPAKLSSIVSPLTDIKLSEVNFKENIQIEKDKIIEKINNTNLNIDKLISYDPICLRNKSNSTEAIIKEYNLLENVLYNSNSENKEIMKSQFKNELKIISPKMISMLNNIHKLDEEDKKKHGKMFKHFIFTDIRSSQYGVKLIGSSLLSYNYNLGYDIELNKPVNEKKPFKKIKLSSENTLEKTKYNNFYILNSNGIFNQSFTKELKKSILENFNKRPENVHGENIRFIIMDSGYKEGIDLFDIKYIHIFEPQTTLADLKQVIGRGTRLCGQKGLDFIRNIGWQLNVYIYDYKIPETIQPLFLNSKTIFETYLKSRNFDVSLYNFQFHLEELSIQGAVDYELNININKFIPDYQTEGEIDMNGGNRSRGYLTHKELQEYIYQDFQPFKWDKLKIENLCVETNSAPQEENKHNYDLIVYSNTQEFIRHYFTPELYYRGMLLWHSVGTGKTCTAILTASSNFENAGYTILWVTRTTLVNDIWKNMFKQVCNENIRDKLLHSSAAFPTNLKDQKKLLSKSWKIQPLSYKQFTNLINKKNKFYQQLVKINGDTDPLRKTLIIIDEAHKLYGQSDLLTTEKPDMNKLHQALMNSYSISKEDSAKLLLMTATPITNDPMELIKLINLCKPLEQQLPEHYNIFKEKYLHEDGSFRQKTQFLDEISGYISYLDRSNDARQFSQPKIHYIETDLITEEDYLAYSNLNLVNKRDNRVLNNIKKEDYNKIKLEKQKVKTLNQGTLTQLRNLKKEINLDDIVNDIENKRIQNKTKQEIKTYIQNVIRDLVEENKTLKNEKFIKYGSDPISPSVIREKEYLYNKKLPYFVIRDKCGDFVEKPNIKQIFQYDHIIQQIQKQLQLLYDKISEKEKQLSYENKIISNEIKLYKITAKRNNIPLDKTIISDKNTSIQQNKENMDKTIKKYNKVINKLKKTRRKRITMIKQNIKINIREQKKLKRELLKRELEELKLKKDKYLQIKQDIEENIILIKKDILAEAQAQAQAQAEAEAEAQTQAEI